MFAENKKSASTACYGGMGCISFRKFLDEIHHFETRLISQSKAVFQERDQLKKYHCWHSSSGKSWINETI